MDEAGLGCKTRYGPIFLQPQQEVFLVFEEGVNNILGAWFFVSLRGRKVKIPPPTTISQYTEIGQASGDGLILYTPLSPILS